MDMPGFDNAVADKVRETAHFMMDEGCFETVAEKARINRLLEETNDSITGMKFVRRATDQFAEDIENALIDISEGK